MKALLALKAEYKTLTGHDLAGGGGGKDKKKKGGKGGDDGKKEQPPAASGGSNEDSQQAKDLKTKVDEQGLVVRDLKTKGAAKVRDELDYYLDVFI